MVLTVTVMGMAVVVMLGEGVIMAMVMMGYGEGGDDKTGGQNKL